jgi:hypothetical protein
MSGLPTIILARRPDPLIVAAHAASTVTPADRRSARDAPIVGTRRTSYVKADHGSNQHSQIAPLLPRSGGVDPRLVEAPKRTLVDPVLDCQCQIQPRKCPIPGNAYCRRLPAIFTRRDVARRQRRAGAARGGKPAPEQMSNWGMSRRRHHGNPVRSASRPDVRTRITLGSLKAGIGPMTGRISSTLDGLQ